MKLFMRGKVIFIIVFIVGMILGIIGLRQGIKIRSAAEITAVVVGEEFETDRDSDGDWITYRYPVYEYSYRGETVQKRATSSGDTAIGEHVTIYVGEDGAMYEKRTARVLTLAGFLMAALSLALWSLFQRRFGIDF